VITDQGGTIAVSGTHTYTATTGMAADQVTVTLKDDGPSVATATAFSLAYVGATVTGAVTLAATEGTAVAGGTRVATFTSSDLADTASAYTATIDWGDGTTSAGTIIGSNGTFTVDAGATGHTPADEGTLGVTITRTADNTTTALTPGTIGEGDALTATPLTFSTMQGTLFSGTVATFTDTDTSNNAADFVATIDWGDGSLPDSSTAGTALITDQDGAITVSGSHTYSSAGQDNVTVTLSDDSPSTLTKTAVGTANVEKPAVAFADANIGFSKAGAEGFTVSGLATDDNGTVTFTDGTTTLQPVAIVDGMATASTIDLTGLKDGQITATLSARDPSGNTLNASGSATLDRDTDEHPTIAFDDANIGLNKAPNEDFTINGLEPEDFGTVTFSDGNPADDVVVNVDGFAFPPPVDLHNMADGKITATLSASDPARNSFNATANAILDRDVEEFVTVSFADANIGAAKAGAEGFTVGGLEPDDTGTVTFSDGNPADDVQVAIVNGAAAASTVKLTGLNDGQISATLSVKDPAGNTFNASASATLDRDTDEHPTIAFDDANIGLNTAPNEGFTISGLEPEDLGTVTFSDGNPADDVVVDVNGFAVPPPVDLHNMADGKITATLSASDPARNSFNATATAILDRDVGEGTVSFADAIIGAAKAGGEGFSVSGLQPDDNGSVTFSDGTNVLSVAIVNGVLAASTVDLTNFKDGQISATLSASDAAGNMFNSIATTTLDTDALEQPTVSFVDAYIGAGKAGAEGFTLSGLELDDNGSVIFSQNGNSLPPVAIVNGVAAASTIDLTSFKDASVTATLSVNDPTGNRTQPARRSIRMRVRARP
jgi:hypothetical protein